eukprot:m51a1_g3968 hypothetical protein (2678) ;mRNA; f:391552-403554
MRLPALLILLAAIPWLPPSLSSPLFFSHGTLGARLHRVADSAGPQARAPASLASPQIVPLGAAQSALGGDEAAARAYVFSALDPTHAAWLVYPQAFEIAGDASSESIELPGSYDDGSAWKVPDYVESSDPNGPEWHSSYSAESNDTNSTDAANSSSTGSTGNETESPANATNASSSSSSASQSISNESSSRDPTADQSGQSDSSSELGSEPSDNEGLESYNAIANESSDELLNESLDDLGSESSEVWSSEMSIDSSIAAKSSAQNESSDARDLDNESSDELQNESSDDLESESSEEWQSEVSKDSSTATSEALVEESSDEEDPDNESSDELEFESSSADGTNQSSGTHAKDSDSSDKLEFESSSAMSESRGTDDFSHNSSDYSENDSDNADNDSEMNESSDELESESSELFSDSDTPENESSQELANDSSDAEWDESSDEDWNESASSGSESMPSEDWANDSVSNNSDASTPSDANDSSSSEGSSYSSSSEATPDPSYETPSFCDLFYGALSPKYAKCYNGIAEYNAAGGTSIAVVRVSPADVEAGALVSSGVNRFGVLFVPDVLAAELSVARDAVTSAVAAQISSFASRGGVVYTSGMSAVLLEPMGLAKAGTFDHRVTLRPRGSGPAWVRIDGCSEPYFNVANESDDRFALRLLCFSPPRSGPFLMDTLVEAPTVLTPDPSFVPVAWHQSHDVVAYDSLTGNMSELGSYEYRHPLLLMRRVGAGYVVAHLANPAQARDSSQYVYNAVFLAGSRPVTMELVYDGPQYIPINTAILTSASFTVTDFFSDDVSPISITIWPRTGSTLSVASGSSCAAVRAGSTAPLSGLSSAAALNCTLGPLEAAGSGTWTIAISISKTCLTSVATGITLLYLSASYSDGIALAVRSLVRSVQVATGDVASVYADAWADPQQYPLHARGSASSVVVSCENRGSASALSARHIAIIPLVSPVLDIADPSSLARLAFFDEEYYYNETNRMAEFSVPFSEGYREDVLDWRVLGERRDILGASWDEAVIPSRVPRSNFPEAGEATGESSSGVYNSNYALTFTDDSMLLMQQSTPDGGKLATPRLVPFTDSWDPKKRSLRVALVRHDISFPGSRTPTGVSNAAKTLVCMDRQPESVSAQCSATSAATSEGSFSSDSGLRETEWINEAMLDCSKTVNPSQALSLPALKLVFSSGNLGSTSVDEFSRIGVYEQELLGHRAVYSASEIHPILEPSLVVRGSGFSSLAHLGTSSTAFSDVGGFQLAVGLPETSRLEWLDSWGRTQVQSLRTVLFERKARPPPGRHVSYQPTFELLDTRGVRRLDWRSDEAFDVRVLIKAWNQFPKWFEITACKANEVLQLCGAGKPCGISRVFQEDLGDTAPPDLQSTRQLIKTGYAAQYGACYSEPDVWLSGRNLNSTELFWENDAQLCPPYDSPLWENDTEADTCEGIAAFVPRISRRTAPGAGPWNWASRVDDYWPRGYITPDMWAMAVPDYEDTTMNKAFKFHMDNVLPRIGNREVRRPESMVAVSLYKGFNGYTLDFSAARSNPLYPTRASWWSDNLQNRDDTLVAGQGTSANNSVGQPASLVVASAWISIDQIAGASEDVADALSNIYTCLFNRRTPQQDPLNTHPYYLGNVFENNVVPMVPGATEHPEWLTKYNCTAGAISYTPDTISQFPNVVYSDSLRNTLSAAISLRGGAKETLSILQRLTATRTLESTLQPYDGARFVYRNPADRDQVVFSDMAPAPLIFAVRNDLSVSQETIPKTAATFFTEVLLHLSVSDPAEVNRVWTDTKYTRSAGYGDFVATVEVGGDGTTCVIQPGATSKIRIKFVNNAGFDIKLRSSAITSPEVSSTKPYVLDSVGAVREVTSYNFLILAIPPEMMPYVNVTPSLLDPDPFFQVGTVNAAVIPDGGKAEYCYDIAVSTSFPLALKGLLQSIAVSVNESLLSGFPGVGDPTGVHSYHVDVPAIRFGVPFPSGTPAAGKVFWVSGYSSSLVVAHTLNYRWTISSAAIMINYAQLTAMRTCTDIFCVNRTWDSMLNSTELCSSFAPYYTGSSSGSSINLTSQVPAFPLAPGGSDVADLHIVMKAKAPIVPPGSQPLMTGMSLSFLDWSGTRKSASTGSTVYVTVHGPYLQMSWSVVLVSDIGRLQLANQLLYPNATTLANAVATISNIGDQPAYNAYVAAGIGLGVVLTYAPSGTDVANISASSVAFAFGAPLPGYASRKFTFSIVILPDTRKGASATARAPLNSRNFSFSGLATFDHSAAGYKHVQQDIGGALKISFTNAKKPVAVLSAAGEPGPALTLTVTHSITGIKGYLWLFRVTGTNASSWRRFAFTTTKWLSVNAGSQWKVLVGRPVLANETAKIDYMVQLTTNTAALLNASTYILEGTANSEASTGGAAKATSQESGGTTAAAKTPVVAFMGLLAGESEGGLMSIPSKSKSSKGSSSKQKWGKKNSVSPDDGMQTIGSHSGAGEKSRKQDADQGIPEIGSRVAQGRDRNIPEVEVPELPSDEGKSRAKTAAAAEEIPEIGSSFAAAASKGKAPRGKDNSIPEPDIPVMGSSEAKKEKRSKRNEGDGIPEIESIDAGDAAKEEDGMEQLGSKIVKPGKAPKTKTPGGPQEPQDDGLESLVSRYDDGLGQLGSHDAVHGPRAMGEEGGEFFGAGDMAELSTHYARHGLGIKMPVLRGGTCTKPVTAQ